MQNIPQSPRLFNLDKRTTKKTKFADEKNDLETHSNLT